MVQYQHPFSNPDLADGWGSWAGGRSQAHRGLDYPQAADTPIPAVADGTVRHNVWNDALGWVLVIAHADGVFSGYSHMIRQSPLAVGASVARGQIIGNVGNEGTASQGNHLHLTITYTHDGTWNNGDLSVTTDPWMYINARRTDNHEEGEDMPSEAWLNGLGQSIINAIRADINWINQGSGNPRSLQAIKTAVDGGRDDLNYVHQVSPYSLKNIRQTQLAGSGALRVAGDEIEPAPVRLASLAAAIRALPAEERETLAEELAPVEALAPTAG